MPHCTKCGANVADNAAFCPSCGATMGIASSSVPATSTQSGLTENVAGLLCYVLGWITGLIFLLIDKRPFVRFHAAQSIVVFGALMVIRIVVGMMFANRRAGRSYRRIFARRDTFLVGFSSRSDSVDSANGQGISG